MTTATAAARMSAIVGEQHVVVDAELRVAYDRDWTGRFGGPSCMVVRPGSVEEVSRVLATCCELDIAVVPQGGNTGLVGGGVPRGGELVLSLVRLDELEPIDGSSGQVTVGAGATLEQVQRHAAASGWAFNVDHGARSAATIGGMVATNAGGSQVLRHGTMRANVAGLEMVLADGRVLRRLGGMAKDATGFDLCGLACGSEGTIAVVTRARLHVMRSVPRGVSALFALHSVESAVALLQDLRERGPELVAAEFFLGDALQLVERHRQLASPFPDDAPAYLLVETTGNTDADIEQLAESAEAVPGVVDVAVAQDAATREALWAYRESINEAIAAEGIPHKLDVSLPIARLAEFLASVGTRVRALEPQARTILFGHLGDGNVHVNLLDLRGDPEPTERAVLELVAELGGSIGAEHGIGVAKAHFIGLSRSPEELDAMRAIKLALDPTGILNPGVLFVQG